MAPGLQGPFTAAMMSDLSGQEGNSVPTRELFCEDMRSSPLFTEEAFADSSFSQANLGSILSLQFLSVSRTLFLDPTRLQKSLSCAHLERR